MHIHLVGVAGTGMGSLAGLLTATHLSARAQAGDTIALLSNGAFGGIHAELIRELGSRNGF